MLGLLAMQDQIHKEICFVLQVLSFFVGVSCKNCVIFSRQFVYFFLVEREVVDCFPKGFA